MSKVKETKQFKAHKTVKSSMIKNKIEINYLFSFFMKAFGYELFYSNEIIEINEQITKVDAIKLLRSFFLENSIVTDDFNNLSTVLHESQYILKDYRIWIMYVIISSKVQSIKFEKVTDIFKNAIDHGINASILFEFFLIFISLQEENDKIERIINSQLPSQFKKIYSANKEKLSLIFETNNSSDNTQLSEANFSFNKYEEDNIIKSNFESKLLSLENFDYQISNTSEDNLLNDISLQNLLKTNKHTDDDLLINNYNDEDGNLDMSTLFFTKSQSLDNYLVPNKNDDLITNNNFDLTLSLKKLNISNENIKYNNVLNKEKLLKLENLEVINSNFENNFIILKLKGNLQQFYNADIMIMPLRITNTYDQKQSINKSLITLRQVYSDFIYHPYDKEIINYI